MPDRSWTYGCLAAGAIAALSISVGQAQEEHRVDVELVLAADVSLSMSRDELQIQRDGYIYALTHESVIEAIESGPYGRIAIAMFEWAGDGSQYIVLPWTVIASREDAEAAASHLTQVSTNSARRTSISGAIDFAADLFAESDYRGMRRVLDVSGDGPNNQGAPVVEARDRLIADGVVINGLPLMTNGGFATVYDVPDLDSYYSECVIGGPGAFMIPVNDWNQFADAVRRKLVLELAGLSPSPQRRANSSPAYVIQVSSDVEGYDCLIGEKRWMNRTWHWPTP